MAALSPRHHQRLAAAPGLLPLLLLVLLLLLTSTPAASALSLPAFLRRSPSPEDAVIAWVRANGGSAAVRVGPVPGRGGLRGMMATAPVPAGSVLVSLPSNLSVPMGTAEYTTPRRFSDPAWFAGHAPYWASLPAAGSVWTKETFTPGDLAELQDDDLAATALQEQTWIGRVYLGQQGNQGVAGLVDLQTATGGTDVGMDEFRHWSAVVASYAFLLPDDAGVVRRVMLPLLDLLNHANEGTNAVVGREGAHFVARATQDISVGDEVRFSYSHGNARNDHALLHYGFLNTDRAADPLLCCADEPGGDLWNCPDTDAGLLERLGGMSEADKEAAAQRLELILDAFVTSEADDVHILAGLNRRAHWRNATLVEFRVLRKRALRRSIAKIRGLDPDMTPLRHLGAHPVKDRTEL